MDTSRETDIVKVKLYTKGEIDFYICKKLNGGEDNLDPDNLLKHIDVEVRVDGDDKRGHSSVEQPKCQKKKKSVQPHCPVLQINDYRYSSVSKSHKKTLLETLLVESPDNEASSVEPHHPTLQVSDHRYSNASKKHKKSLLEDLLTKPEDNDKETISICIIYQCDICYEKLSSEASLKVHKGQHQTEDYMETLVCPVCGLAAPDSQFLRIHLKGHPKPKKYGCGICGARFNWKSSVYIHHKRIHQGIQEDTKAKEKSHECEKCASKFRSVAQLKMHLRTHTGEKPFQCEVCLRSFAVKTSLESHERTHTGEKPFQCELCGQLYTQASGLQRHHLLHIGIRDFKCETCGLKFIDKHRLRRHTLRHTKQQLHDCPLCGRQFLDKSTLRKHKKLHDIKKFICSICSKGFDREELLTNHMEYHTASKPFACDTCGKSFTDKQLLASHEKCHSKITPYQCDICGKRYTWRSSLGYHQRKHMEHLEFLDNDDEESE